MRWLITIGSPDCVAGFGIQCEQERLILAVHLQIEHAFMQQRRTGCAPVVTLQLFMPHLCTIHVVAIQSGHAEVRVDSFAIRDGSFGSVRVLQMTPHWRMPFASYILPQYVTIFGIQTSHFPAIFSARQVTAISSFPILPGSSCPARLNSTFRLLRHDGCSARNSLLSRTTAFPSGPRNCGQLSAVAQDSITAAKAIETVKICRNMNSSKRKHSNQRDLRVANRMCLESVTW
jgi:hypothetical protein